MNISKENNIMTNTNDYHINPEYQNISSLNFKKEKSHKRIENYFKEKRPWIYAYINGGRPDKMYVTYYNDKKDSYTYEQSSDEYGNPMDYSSIMWCPPVNWIKPIIYWDRIWIEMDYQRTGIRRPFLFYPEKDINHIKYKSYIQFLNSKM